MVNKKVSTVNKSRYNDDKSLSDYVLENFLNMYAPEASSSPISTSLPSVIPQKRASFQLAQEEEIIESKIVGHNPPLEFENTQNIVDVQVEELDPSQITDTENTSTNAQLMEHKTIETEEQPDTTDTFQNDITQVSDILDLLYADFELTNTNTQAIINDQIDDNVPDTPDSVYVDVELTNTNTQVIINDQVDDIDSDKNAMSVDELVINSIQNLDTKKANTVLEANDNDVVEDMVEVEEIIEVDELEVEEEVEEEEKEVDKLEDYAFENESESIEMAVESAENIANYNSLEADDDSDDDPFVDTSDILPDFAEANDNLNETTDILQDINESSEDDEFFDVNETFRNDNSRAATPNINQRHVEDDTSTIDVSDPVDQTERSKDTVEILPINLEEEEEEPDIPQTINESDNSFQSIDDESLLLDVPEDVQQDASESIHFDVNEVVNESKRSMVSEQVIIEAAIASIAPENLQSTASDNLVAEKRYADILRSDANKDSRLELPSESSQQIVIETSSALDLENMELEVIEVSEIMESPDVQAMDLDDIQSIDLPSLPNLIDTEEELVTSGDSLVVNSVQNRFGLSSYLNESDELVEEYQEPIIKAESEPNINVGNVHTSNFIDLTSDQDSDIAFDEEDDDNGNIAYIGLSSTEDDIETESIEDELEIEDVQTQQAVALPLDDIPLGCLDSSDNDTRRTFAKLNVSSLSKVSIWWYDAHDSNQNGIVFLFGKV